MQSLQHRLTEWSMIEPLFPQHMSFIMGPRQCGKTTLALQLLKNQNLSIQDYYFNWDRTEIRKKFREGSDWISGLRKPPSPNLSLRKPLLVFDEIHKVRHWKRLLKGIYDQHREDFQWLITGSGRLDFYQRGGDSLAGRYDPYFLFPFSPAEIAGSSVVQSHLHLADLLETPSLSETLIQAWELCGGFPEPFLSQSEAKATRWWKQYQIRVTEEDLRDLTQLESIDLMRDILRLLPTKISAPLSIQSIRETVETSFATAKRYLTTLNQLFLIFEVTPYSKKIHRSIKKEKKIYFFHHPAVTEKGARFENMVALLLKRWASEQNEKANGEYELHYLRDQDRREVDFLITLNQKPYFLFEVKYSDTQLSSALQFYSEKLNIPGLQIIRTPHIRIKKSPSLGVLSFDSLAAYLG